MKSYRNTEKIITLTQEQKDIVLGKLEEQTGNFDIFIEINDDLTIEAKGYLYVHGYREDDYFNGTGAFVETSREADVVLTAYVYREGEGEKEGVFDVESEFEKECYEYLNKAA